MVLWTTFFSLQFQANFLVGEKNLPGSGSGSGSGLRFLAGSGSGFNEYGSETLVLLPEGGIGEYQVDQGGQASVPQDGDDPVRHGWLQALILLLLHQLRYIVHHTWGNNTLFLTNMTTKLTKAKKISMTVQQDWTDFCWFPNFYNI